MYRNLIYPIFAIILSVLSAGCASEKFDNPAEEETGNGNVTIRFSNSKMGSRATTPDNTQGWNEDLIGNILIALYTSDASDDELPLYVSTFTKNANAQTTVEFSLSKTQTDNLFGVTGAAVTGSTCRMVAVANLPANVSVPENPTITELRNLGITADFKAETENERIQSSFVMYGEGTLTYTAGEYGGTAAGEATLYRAAARIMLNVSVIDEVVNGEGENEVKWVSHPEYMRVLLSNGVSRSIVDPAANEVVLTDADYFNVSASDTRYLFTKTDAAKYPWQIEVPFYTYPNKWENTIDETHRTYMTLMIPWQMGDDQTYQWCYYQVPVTESSVTELTRNYAYQVNLNIQMLGSFSPEEPTDEIECSYVTVPWSEVETPVDITGTRYLVVNQNNYVIDNSPEITIPFYSSHNAVVESCTMEFYRYNVFYDGSDRYGEVVTFKVDDAINNRSGSATDRIYSATVTQQTTSGGNYVLTLSHPLVIWNPRNASNSVLDFTEITERQYNTRVGQINNYAKTNPVQLAYSPYKFTIVVRHEDSLGATTFRETIVIDQYPAMWIDAKKNPGGGPRGAGGNVFVNATYSSNRWTSDTDLGGVSSLSGNNSNPNMYVITINVLDAEYSNYIIGDPRSLNINNTLSGTGDLNPTTTSATAASWSKSNAALYGTDPRRLTYYYPTNESDAYKMVVAPKIRVASSYGKTGTLSRQNARRRCATYQETGCPAGRWRVPTYGEMSFIVNLSNSGKIPLLFSNSTTYLSAQGWVDVPRSNGTFPANAYDSDQKEYVRCVYDEWYWEGMTDYTISPDGNGNYTFTWGDMPKGNPEAGHNN